jgi:hypothetical protein
MGTTPANCSSGTVIFTGIGTSFTHTGLTGGTTYFYRACALDKAGNISTGASASATPSGASVGPVTPTLVGFVPGVGSARDVVVNSATGVAYVASADFGLSVVNVTQPASPVVTGAANPPFYGGRVAFAGTHAFVAGNGWAVVVDISNPADPTPVGTLAGTMGGVAMAGQYAYALLYVAGNPGHYDLVVVSLAVPSAPAIVGRTTVGGGGDVKVVGSLAYVAAAAAGLQIVDVSNPAAPRIVGTANTPGSAKAVAVANGYAYVADTSTLQVIDVRNSSAPFVAGSLASAANAVAVAGTRAYAVNGSQLLVIDVATPTSPRLLSATDSRGAQAVAAMGNVVLLASPMVDHSANTGGLYVEDASIPTSPVVRANALGGFPSADVAATGTLAAVAGNTGLKVVDVSNPAFPRSVGTLVAASMMKVAMAGQYAYVLQYVSGNPGHYDLVVVSLGAPTAPAIVGRITVGGGSAVKAVGTLVYVAAGATGLQIVDVSNPAAPRILGTANTPGSAKGVAVANGYAYVADTTTIQVVDVHNASGPFIVGSLATAANAVAVAGSRVYALSGSQLLVIDVASPSAPRLLSATNGYGAQAIDVVGTRAFLATPALDHGDPAAGIRVVDVTNAAAPLLVEQIEVPGSPLAVFATPSYVYAADDAAVVDVIKVGP